MAYMFVFKRDLRMDGGELLFLLGHSLRLSACVASQKGIWSQLPVQMLQEHAFLVTINCRTSYRHTQLQMTCKQITVID